MRHATFFALSVLLFASTHAQADASFDQCKLGLMDMAESVGMSAEQSHDLFSPIAYQPDVIKAMNAQPEFKTHVWDYLAGLVDQERIDDGRAMLTQHQDTLSKIEKQYGVNPATVVAVWGVESNFGKIKGKRPLLESLSTLSCKGRRQAFFKSELKALLQLIQAGDLNQGGHITGSWAGAFGQTQFMPSTYQRLAVDFDGDGRRDLVDSVPDALASTANYLKKAGWQTGQPWGHEVVFLSKAKAGKFGRKNRRSVAEWQKRGIRFMDTGVRVDPKKKAAIIQPVANGPAWMVFKNYNAIYSYNASQSYALAIAMLSDALRGGASAPRTAWPTSDAGLSRAERRQVQTWLIEQGHDIGEVDGILGGKSSAAIKKEQRKHGMKPTGRAGQAFLKLTYLGGKPPADLKIHSTKAKKPAVVKPKRSQR